MTRISFLLALLFAFGLGFGVAKATPPMGPGIKVEQAKKKEFKTGISWQISPSHVIVYLDGKKLGEAGKLTFTNAKPGKHAIRLVKEGDEEELEVKVVKGQVLQMVYTFSDG